MFSSKKILLCHVDDDRGQATTTTSQDGRLLQYAPRTCSDHTHQATGQGNAENSNEETRVKSKKMELKIDFNSTVKSVQLYSCETWRTQHTKTAHLQQ